MVTFENLSSYSINLDFVSYWYRKIIENERKIFGEIAIIIGSDDWLLQINQKYLQHDFYTDVITFDYCEDDIVSGDLFISIDRVYENAKLYNVSRETELNRVIAHGLLHLLGYNDKSEQDIKIIRSMEEKCLSLL